jgi:hypothetical protein
MVLSYESQSTSGRAEAEHRKKIPCLKGELAFQGQDEDQLLADRGVFIVDNISNLNYICASEWIDFCSF